MSGNNKKVAFAIVTTQRSGSTWLQTSLDSHPQINCHGELFLPTYRHYPGYMGYLLGKKVGLLGGYILRRRLVYSYLDSIYSAGEADAIGFKVMYGQFRRLPYRYPMIFDYFEDNDVKVIHLVRCNPVNVLISRYRKSVTGVPHAKTEDDYKNTQKKITIPVDLMIKELDKIEFQKQEWRECLSRFDCTEIGYEDLATDPQNVTRQMLEFLQVECGTALDSPLRKIAAKPNSETVLNFVEVERALKGTPYEQYI